MKKIAYILAAVLLAACLCACGESAAQPTDSGYSSPTDIEMPEIPSTPTPEPQPVKKLVLCGIQLVRDGQLTGIAYEGVGYSEGVLTLDGAEIISDYASFPAIEFSGDLEIVLKGENSVAATNGMSAIVGGGEEPDYAATLKITGDGSLTVNAEGEDASGLVCTGAVRVESGSLDITGGASAISGEGGAVTYGSGIGVLEHTQTHIVIGSAG